MYSFVLAPVLSIVRPISFSQNLVFVTKGFVACYYASEQIMATYDIVCLELDSNLEWLCIINIILLEDLHRMIRKLKQW
jgi:hypothetical protein